MPPWIRMGVDLPTVTSGEPLLLFIRRHLDDAGRLPLGGVNLPDEAASGNTGMRWAAGALDGVFGHHGGSSDDLRDAQNIAEVMVKACERPTRRRLRSLHGALAETEALAIVDLLLEDLAHRQPDAGAVRRIGLWLCSTSPNRGPVKIGLALLGATGVGGHVDIIRTLGAHDEFTLYAATALQNGVKEPDSELWALAASVDGWGRIQCVERLRNTKDQQIRSWLLREGYKNSIMYEYTAFIAAETGGLLAALEHDPDRVLLTAAGEILRALIQGGPAEDIGAYVDGAEAIERYLTLMRSRAESFDDYLAVAAIRDFVGADHSRQIDQPGWDESRRDAFLAVSLEILGQSYWRDRVAASLTLDASNSDIWKAQAVARDLGIDTFEVTFRRLEQDPLGGDWSEAWRNADADRARRLVTLAQAQLPLAEIASGPGEALGLGPEFKAHQALEWSLQALRDHPGIGGDLLIIGLQSPVIRNRNMALNAFQRWPAESLPPKARELIDTTAATDPYDQTRELAARVLRGEPSD